MTTIHTYCLVISSSAVLEEKVEDTGSHVTVKQREGSNESQFLQKVWYLRKGEGRGLKVTKVEVRVFFRMKRHEFVIIVSVEG